VAEGRKWAISYLAFDEKGGEGGVLLNEDGTGVYCSLLIEREDRQALTSDECDFVLRTINRVAGWTTYALHNGGRVTRPKLSGKTKTEVMARDGNRCAACGGTPPVARLDVHHYVEGLHVPDNLVTLCVNCHRLAEGIAAKRLKAKREDFADPNQYRRLVRIAGKTTPRPQAERARAARHLLSDKEREVM